jgi:hypothetical protein
MACLWYPGRAWVLDLSEVGTLSGLFLSVRAGNQPYRSVHLALVSRGHGHVQREILRLVADSAPFESRGYTIAELAAEIYGTDTPTDSQRRAVQRAVKALGMAVWTHKANLGTKDNGYATPGLIVWRAPNDGDEFATIAILGAMLGFEELRRMAYGSGLTLADLNRALTEMG